MRAVLTFNEAHEIDQHRFPIHSLVGWLEEVLEDLKRDPATRIRIRWPQVFRSRWSAKPGDPAAEVDLLGSHFREAELVIPEPALLGDTGPSIAAWLREKAEEIEAYGRGKRPDGEWAQDVTFTWTRPFAGEQGGCG